MVVVTGILFSLGGSGGKFESDNAEESVEVVGNLLIEAVELGLFVILEFGVAGERCEEAGGERGVNALEEF